MGLKTKPVRGFGTKNENDLYDHKRRRVYKQRAIRAFTLFSAVLAARNRVRPFTE